MLFTTGASLVAGLLTVLAPCVLPLLPVILGGSLVSEGRDRWRPYLITGSLVISLVVFTVLLKASTALIGIDPRVWTYLSGGLILVIGISMLVPGLWTRITEAIGFERRSHDLLDKAYHTRSRTWSAILTGAALGPVFSSCSPTYAWAIATVLPASPARGMLYLSAYCLGVGVGLLGIALLGRRLLTRISWVSKPNGWFQRVVAVLFVLVGLSLVTGMDKVIQTRLVELDPWGITRFEQRLVPTSSDTKPAEMNAADLTAPAAPEIVGIDHWINSPPLTLAQLKGKVVLVDFWTYSCINCQRTQPYVNAWYDAYADDGLVVIGVHAPEFAFEKVPANVERAVAAAGIAYPVALDNDFRTWRAYDNNYWPAKYLIDRDGRVRYTHFGEGDYDVTESTIRKLLGESVGSSPRATVPADAPDGGSRTPETYLGTSRAARYVGTPGLPTGGTYQPAASLQKDQWTLGGAWTPSGESLTAAEDGATLTLRFTGKEVHLVMGGPPGSTVSVVTAGGVATGPEVVGGKVTVSDHRLYTLVRSTSSVTGETLHLTFSAGVTVNAFTFG